MPEPVASSHQQDPDLVVQMLEHAEVFGGRAFAEFCPRIGRAFISAGGVFVDKRGRGAELRMRCHVRGVGEPRRRLMLPDETDDIIRNRRDGLVFDVVGFASGSAKIKPIVVEVFATVAADQIGGDMVVGDMPFAAHTSGVAGLTEGGGKRGDFRFQAMIRFRRTQESSWGFFLGKHLEKAGTAAVLPGKQRRP